MLVLNSEITIGTFLFDFVTEVQVSRSVDELTSGGTITLPKNIVYKKDNQIIENIVEGENALFKRGDAVQIKLGYAPNLETYFNGFVSNITPAFPLLFEVDDNMYTLKQTAVDPLNLTATTLSDLLSQIVPSDISFTAADVNLGNFRVKKKTTVAKILEYIKDRYGLSAYMLEDGTLYVGLAFDLTNIDTTNAPIFQFTKNIIDDTDLIYQRAEDQLIKMTATSIFPDNTKIEIELGDEDGEQRTFFQYNVSESDLRTLATEELDKLKYEGFKGSFTTFIEPKVSPGDVIQIINEAFPEKDGFYLVRGVGYSFGINGGRQKIELERKVS